MAVFTSAIVGTLTETERQRRVLRDQAAQMAGEVNAARRIQMGLLPDPRELLGDGRRFQLAAELEPARTVGGDFYDCFMLDRRRLPHPSSGKRLGTVPPPHLRVAGTVGHRKIIAIDLRNMRQHGDRETLNAHRSSYLILHLSVALTLAATSSPRFACIPLDARDLSLDAG